MSRILTVTYSTPISDGFFAGAKFEEPAQAALASFQAIGPETTMTINVAEPKKARKPRVAAPAPAANVSEIKPASKKSA